MSTKKAPLEGVAGVDEAGRGPMIGPLVVSGVRIHQEELHRLKDSGVKDSKLLTPKRRSQLAAQVEDIADKIETRAVSAAEIDRLRARGVTLNEIEVQQFVLVLSSLRPKTAYLDAADVKAERFGAVIGDRSGLTSLGCVIISEHKADAKYPVVSAASIIAKEERERIIQELHLKYGDFGSGYPTDPKSIEYIRGTVASGLELPPIIRKSWESVRRVLNERNTTQQTLDG